MTFTHFTVIFFDFQKVSRGMQEQTNGVLESFVSIPLNKSLTEYVQLYCLECILNVLC